MIVVRASCPHCAAPLALADRQAQALCGYCNASLRIEEPPDVGAAPAGATALIRQEIPPAEIDRVKQLVLDGKRAEAIADYSRLASVPADVAEQAIDQLMLPTVTSLIRHMPLNSFGFALYFVLVAGFGSLAWWALGRALAGAWWGWLIGVPAALIALRQLWSFLPKAASSWTSSLGSVGRATVITRAIIRPNFARGGSIVLVAFSVEPGGGGAPFVDQEVLFLRDASVAKLDPGNVVPVRYDEPGRRRVFPISPIRVLRNAEGV